MQEPELPGSSGIYCSEMDFTATGRYEGIVALSVQPALWRTFQAPEWEDETDDKSGSQKHSDAFIIYRSSNFSLPGIVLAVVVLMMVFKPKMSREAVECSEENDDLVVREYVRRLNSI